MSATKVEIASKIKFADICRMLEKIRKSQGARQKEEIFQRYLESFNEFRREFKEKNSENECDCSFYPVLRCLIPGADNARPSYGIQLTTMGRLYIKVLNLATNGDDARKLNQTESVRGCSDYADVVYSVMEPRSRNTNSTLTLADIHQLLDTIAENDRRKTEVELIKFIEVASALEQKWLIRIILKSLRLGIGEKKIFSLYHPRARELYSCTTDLQKVCECVDSGAALVMSDSVQPFQYIRPMLCEPLDMVKVENMLKQNVYYLETKMDGERFHIHILDDTYKYISRNGKDYTGNFGAGIEHGNLTPLLAKCFNVKLQSAIIDGEMMVWDSDASGFRVKGENYDVKSLGRNGHLKPCFVAYDIIYLNGVSHIDKQYAERMALLEKIIKEQQSVMMLCKRSKITNVHQLINYFNEALEAKEEGVVIKAQNSFYKPGLRNGGWYKIKPDYIHGVIKEFDLAVIGAYYNRTRTYIDSYLLGVYVKNGENIDNPRFYSVAKVGIGLSYAQRLKLNESLRPHWNNANGQENASIEWGAQIPDVWIDPIKSVILQIKATELTETTSFRTSHTLRFPRIEAIRYDKPWYECMTLEEFESFSKNQSSRIAKINKRQLTADDLLPPKKIRNARTSNNNPYASVFNANEVTKISDVCNDLQFCILSTTTGSPNKPTVDQLKAMAVRYGGKIVENPTLDTKKCICIAGDLTGRVRRLMATGRYNIVSVDWMTRSFDSDHFSASLAQPKPRDMICMTSDMEEEYKKYFDEYGDSYTDEVDFAELEVIMKNVNVTTVPKILDNELLELDKDLFGTTDAGNIFRHINAYFFAPGVHLPNILIIAKLMFQSKGGILIESNQLSDTKKMLYIFVDRASFDHEKFTDWMHSIFSKHKSTVKVLSYNWILDCDKENKLQDLTGYLIYEKS